MTYPALGALDVVTSSELREAAQAEGTATRQNQRHMSDFCKLNLQEAVEIHEVSAH